MQITGKYRMLTVSSHAGAVLGVIAVTFCSGWLGNSMVGVVIGTAAASFFLNMGATTTLVALRKQLFRDFTPVRRIITVGD